MCSVREVLGRFLGISMYQIDGGIHQVLASDNPSRQGGGKDREPKVHGLAY